MNTYKKNPATSSTSISGKLNRSKAHCCVPLCSKNGYVLEHGEKVTFHSLPKNQDRLQKWIVTMKRDLGEKFTVTKSTRICSRHFQEKDFNTTSKGRRFLNASAVPSIFIWTKKVRNRVRKKRSGASSTEQSTAMSSEVTIHGPDTEIDIARERIHQLERELQQTKEQLKLQREAAEFFQKERDHIRDILRSRTQEDAKKGIFGLERFKSNDSDISFYTGFPDYEALCQCLLVLNPGKNGEHIIYVNTDTTRKNTRNRKLSVNDEFFMTLVRLRLGVFENHLAHLFAVSQSTVQRVCTTWLNFMYLKLGSINIWPTKKAIIATMPESMKAKYPNLEWIIDAFEIQSERPSSLMLQSQSYSNYKSRNTLKGLVACTPSGQIGFVSQLYTGNISDRELMIRSGFLSMPHTRGAMWLVDKGFLIQDLADPLGVTVNMPAFVGSKSQMSAQDVFQTQMVASERIHIERAINKIKNFHIFDRPILLSTYGSVNQMWAVCALLTLFQNPIISA